MHDARNIQVIFVTQKNALQDIFEALREDIFGYLTKPASKEIFLSLINRAIKEFEKPKVRLM